jgi:hypothetical protein
VILPDKNSTHSKARFINWAIARGDAYNTKVFSLIQYFEADGRIEEFIRVVVKNKPESPFLQDVKREFPDILAGLNDIVSPSDKKEDNLGKWLAGVIGVSIFTWLIMYLTLPTFQGRAILIGSDKNLDENGAKYEQEQAKQKNNKGRIEIFKRQGWYATVITDVGNQDDIEQLLRNNSNKNPVVIDDFKTWCGTENPKRKTSTKNTEYYECK